MAVMWLEIELAGKGPTLQIVGRGSRGERPAVHEVSQEKVLDLVRGFSAKVGRAVATATTFEPPLVQHAQSLYEEILNGELRDVLSRLVEASKEQSPVLVRLFIHDDTLQSVPWEAICKPGRAEGFWGTDPRIVVARGVLSPEAWDAKTIDGAVRLLVIAPAESSTAISALRQALTFQSNEIEWLEPIMGPAINAARLYERIRNGPAPHIVHFIGHGGIDSNGTPALRLADDEDGEETWISAEALARELGAHFASTLQLVILEACEGAKPGLFGSAAECFATTGASAVVAHLWPVRAETARHCSSVLYRSLLVEPHTRGDIGAAVAAMRRTLLTTSAEAFSPILCLRGESSVIFQFRPPIASMDVAAQPDDDSEAPESIAPPVFLGREKELAQLRTLLDDAHAEKTCMAFVSGEPGSGKTSLIDTFCRQMAQEPTPIVFVGGQCAPRTGQADPYAPIVDVLLHLIGAVRLQAMPTNRPALAEVRLSALRMLCAVGTDLIGPLIPASVVLPLIATTAAQGHAWAKDAHAKLLQSRHEPRNLLTNVVHWQITEIFTKIAAAHSLVIVLEDLHWIDDASAGLLLHLVTRLQRSKILILGTYHHSVLSATAGTPHPMTLVLREALRIHGDIVVNLDAISVDDRKRWLDTLLDTNQSPSDAAFRQSLFEHTGGHPLFVLELLHALHARAPEADLSTTTTIDWGRLPSRIEGVIGERLADLDAAERDLLGMASVEGHDFTLHVLSSLRKEDERSLLRTISQGLEKNHRIVMPRGTQRVGQRRTIGYRFTQGLVQQYVYDNLSEGERILLHGDIADCLEKLHEGQTEAVAVVLAHHYEQAGDLEKALDYLILAGQRARRVSAFRAALGHVEKALDLVGRLDPSPENMRRELSMRILHCVVLEAMDGIYTPKLEQTSQRTRELCAALDDRASLAMILIGLAVGAFSRLDFPQVEALAQECLAIGKSLGDNKIMATAHGVLAMVCYWSVSVETTQQHIEEVQRLYDVADRAWYQSATSQDPFGLTLVLSTWIRWLEGDAVGAMDDAQTLAAMAETIGDPLGYASTLQSVAQFAWLLDRRDLYMQTAKQILEIGLKYELSYFIGWGRMLLDYRFEAEVGSDYAQKLDATYREFLSANNTHSLMYIWCTHLLWNAYHLCGDDLRALETIEEVLAFVSKYKVNLCAPPSWLYKAKSLVRLGRRTDADDALREALRIAKEYGNKVTAQEILNLIASLPTT